jgi:hypothetical protein
MCCRQVDLKKTCLSSFPTATNATSQVVEQSAHELLEDVPVFQCKYEIYRCKGVACCLTHPCVALTVSCRWRKCDLVFASRNACLQHTLRLHLPQLAGPVKCRLRACSAIVQPADVGNRVSRCACRHLTQTGTLAGSTHQSTPGQLHLSQSYPMQVYRIALRNTSSVLFKGLTPTYLALGSGVAITCFTTTFSASST